MDVHERELMESSRRGKGVTVRQIVREKGRRRGLFCSDGRRRVDIGVAERTLVRLEERPHLDRLVQRSESDFGSHGGLFAHERNREQVSETKVEKKEARGGRTDVAGDGVGKVERDEVVADVVQVVGRLTLPLPPDSVEVGV